MKGLNSVSKGKIGRIISLLLLMVALAISGCSLTPNAAKPAAGASQSAPPSQEATQPAQGQAVPQPSVSEQKAAPNLRVHYLDVGQADAMLIQTPANENILIDAGERDDAPLIIAYAQKLGITRFDLIVATHPHDDHIGGMAKLLQTFDTDQLLMPKVTTTTRTFENLLLAIRSKNLKITEAKKGVKIELASVTHSGKKIDLEILSPIATNYEDLNNYSAVVRLVYGETAFLFTGDAEVLVEKEILKANPNIRSQVLKVGHHGSSSSTSAAFLQAVSPSYAVISVAADNKYGHPSATVLERLKKAGVTVFRTDQGGTILAESNGEQVTMTPTRR